MPMSGNKETNRPRAALDLARVEKGEVIPVNTAPKNYLPQFAENYYWALSTKLGTRLLRQEKIASRILTGKKFHKK